MAGSVDQSLGTENVCVLRRSEGTDDTADGHGSVSDLEIDDGE